MTTIEALEAAIINSNKFCILEKETVIDARDELKKNSRYAEFPVIMGQQITREEIIEGLREMYDSMVKYESISDPALVRFPDAEIILDYIEQSGLPPKTKSDDE